MTQEIVITDSCENARTTKLRAIASHNDDDDDDMMMMSNTKSNGCRLTRTQANSYPTPSRTLTNYYWIRVGLGTTWQGRVGMGTSLLETSLSLRKLGS